MNTRLHLILASIAVLCPVGCIRTVLVNELDVPGLCPEAGLNPAVPSLRLLLDTGYPRPSLRGVIFDNSTAARLPGTQVRLDYPARTVALTDSAGQFAFDSILPGPNVLRSFRIGFVARTDTLMIPDSTVVRLSIPMAIQSLDGPCSGFADVPVRKLVWPWRR
jgi:hypothetical protein